MTERQAERERIAKWLEAKAVSMEEWLREQPSFFLQSSDQDHTSTYIKALRDVASCLKNDAS